MGESVMTTTVNMLVGSSHHKQLTQRVELAQKKRIDPTWNYEGTVMKIVDVYRCGDTNYMGVVLENIN